jgi:uncharacterized protein YgbK (DUF1537 family)
MTVQVGIIADDLSGGNTIGFEFSQIGFETCLVQTMDSDLSLKADVIIFDTETRLCNQDQAYQRVNEAARKICAPIMIKKIDSLLRGNVGTEIKAVMDGQNYSHVLVLAASPNAGRTTVGGFQLVNGALVTDQKITDPSSNVHESHIPTLLTIQMGMEAAHLPLEIILKGKGAILEFLECKMKTHSLIIADGTIQDHLNLVIEAAYSLGIRFFSGTYGLGQAIGKLLSNGQTIPRSVLTVIGSVSEVTRKQVNVASRDPRTQVIEVENIEDINIENCHGKIAEAITKGMDVLLYSAPNKDNLYPFLDKAESQGINQEEVDQKLAKVIQLLVQPFLPKISGLVLSGGATAQAVFQMLSSTGVRIEPYEVVTGVPVARIINGPYAGLLFLTKPGAYGDEGSLQEMISYARLQGGMRVKLAGPERGN